MSAISTTETNLSLFPQLEGEAPCPAPEPARPVRSARSRNRAAWWQQDLNRATSYLMGQAHTAEDRAYVADLYDQALDEGPDFISYRSRSAFQAAPKLGIDRNAYARIVYALECIERGTYRQCREKGKQGIPRTAVRVLKALLGLALKFGEVRPSLEGIKRLACVSKQTVVNCLKVLTLYGFVIVHRRVKRVRTPLGSKVVQDTNAYTIQEPRGLGAIAVRLFTQGSESKKLAASSIDIYSTKKFGVKSPSPNIPDGVFDNLYDQWEATEA